jgi:hypothetical protein
MAHGSGLIKFGENGKGLRSRWYPKTLKNRIMSISDLQDKIAFIQCDGMEVLRANAHRSDAVFFLDPPYTAAGKKAGTRLYKYNELDHDELFRITAAVKGDFLMTYDNAKGVLDLADRHGFDTEAIPVKNTHHAEMTELLIGRNLDWVRSMTQAQKKRTILVRGIREHSRNSSSWQRRKIKSNRRRYGTVEPTRSTSQTPLRRQDAAGTDHAPAPNRRHGSAD